MKCDGHPLQTSYCYLDEAHREASAAAWEHNLVPAVLVLIMAWAMLWLVKHSFVLAQWRQCWECKGTGVIPGPADGTAVECSSCNGEGKEWDD